MKILITITSLLIITNLKSFSQASSVTNDAIKETVKPAFYLYYGLAGLGSNLGRFQPTIKIHETNFIFTYEQNSYWKEKSKEVDTICAGTLRQSSIDSILHLIRLLTDSIIFKANPCITSGGIHFLTVSNSIDTTRFELMNTFDYTALKIIDIINTYLPKEKKLWPTEKLIKEEEDCRTYMNKKIESDNHKKQKKMSKKKTT
ncbi:MAG: hypothetical protein QM725_02845 [Lacibacter sp.]